MTNSPLDSYISEIHRNLSAGNATEHTHRPALQVLLQSLVDGLQVTNEPKQRTDCGAPDMVVMRAKGLLVLGHVEAKDVGISLAEIRKTEQLKRYLKYLPNLILTDYVNFHWFVNGESWGEATLGQVNSAGHVRSTPAQCESVLKLLGDFIAQSPQPINKPRALAERLARLTHMTRDIVIEAFERKQASGVLKDLRQVLAESLIPNLIEDDQTPQFADLYAQTLTYGLFAACCNHHQTGGGEFTLDAAAREIPRTNPLLRQLFSAITGPDFQDEPYAGFIRELVAILNHTRIKEVLEDFGQSAVRQDPILHFYETFLATYDPALREKRGVYYTPEPVVSYIVRSVDHILKTKFKIKDGLADTKKDTYQPLGHHGHPDVEPPTSHRTLILDPAAGTGTFLYEVIDHIRQRFRKQKRAGFWNEYVHDHLLPRLFGFELLMAPYAMAHLKLGMQLAGQDMPELERGLFTYGFQTDDRLQVYLTNTLEQVEEHTQVAMGSLQRAIGEEAAQARKIKRDLPILVVLGNPPYSGVSSNKGAWINGLLKGKLPDGTTTASYYHVDGKPLGEKKLWLQDDYVKFIRWAQWRLEQTGQGVLAFITNHGYLDNPTFRGMRWSLMQAFDEIYVLDLHGNSKKKEVAPGGEQDDPVFDIQQGVAIGLFIKRGNKKDNDRQASIHHAELWGKRSDKYQWLAEKDIETTEWEHVGADEPFYLFKPFDRSEVGDYDSWPSLSTVLPINSVGIVTARDSLTIHFDREALWKTVINFTELTQEDARKEYQLGKDVQSWKVAWAQEDVKDTGPNATNLSRKCHIGKDMRAALITTIHWQVVSSSGETIQITRTITRAHDRNQ